MKNLSIRWLLFIVAAELIASFAVWHGTPTDWKGKPPHFWYFEILRLRYWFGFGLLFASVWVIGWLSVRRFSVALIPAVLCVLCAVATEVMTSIYFWRSLSSNQASYLGWSDSRQYFREHLVSWVVVVVIAGLFLWYLGHRKQQSPTAGPAVEGNAQRR